MTYLGVGQSARRVCVWLCVCVCACSSLSLPCLLRHKHPLIKAVISLPSDGTLAHVKEVGAGGRGISGAPGSFSEKTCARVYLRACARVSSACNQQLRSVHQRLSVGVFWCRAMTTALCLHRGDSLRYEKIWRNDREMDGFESRQLGPQSFESFPWSVALWSPASIWHLISLAVERWEDRK